MMSKNRIRYIIFHCKLMMMMMVVLVDDNMVTIYGNERGRETTRIRLYIRCLLFVIDDDRCM